MSYDRWNWDSNRGDTDPWEEPRHTERHGSFESGRRLSTPLKIVIAIIILFIALITVGIFVFTNVVFEIATPEPSIREEYTEDYPSSMDEFMESFFTTAAESNTLETTATDASITLDLSNGNTELLSLQEIYANCSPSIVAITTEVGGIIYGWGTGIIFSSDGYIITNSHVLDGTDKAIVTTYDDTEYEALLVGYDSTSDLAVIKVDAKNLVPATFGDSDTLLVGDAVVAIGNPLGEELRGTMTDGIISAINRDISIDGNSMTLLQTNAAINGGNSGGALVDMSGNIIGITNMKMTSYYDTIEGIGFAIPTSIAKPVVDSIMANGYVVGRPAIGITVGQVVDAVQSEYGVPAGVYVSDVTKNSGADVAGVLAGDIITHADGIEVLTSDELNAVKADFAVGDVFTLTVWRDGETMDIDVILMDTGNIYG